MQLFTLSIGGNVEHKLLQSPKVGILRFCVCLYTKHTQIPKIPTFEDICNFKAKSPMEHGEYDYNES